MADYCLACENLKEYAPNFVVNGITEKECSSLHNNMGLNPELAVLHENCEDLNDMLDCLIGALQEKLPSYDVCDWKEYTDELMSNIYNLQKAIICSECGLWEALEQASYVGTATLWTTESTSMGGENIDLTPAFNRMTQQSNMPEGVFSRTADFKGIVVNNITEVPLLINSTFNCSIDTDQVLSATYIVITKDGNKIGQTPFIAPVTYDQQVAAEAFILEPGQSVTMRYYMRIGAANTAFIPIFGGTGNISCVLAADDPSDPANQRSYFNVSATSIMRQKTSVQ
ncbi:hypothetical protein IW492_01805 [Enterococcus sp. BWB1-3]|uniref:hypothetical protein n=1 Tax=Enterococcus sp. BWB1-3 TaxID=2787713 RepID=UPI001922F63B|nr:hypothetical protein [Enterococcus sp. BWB1-3]MBL1227963.1 hypothetical protein [Enterococcus sp. BWB1-3]